MKKSVYTRHSLLVSGLSLLICAMMLVGTTFAWFTDKVTNTGNHIEAGTLEVDLLELNKNTSAFDSLKTSTAPVFDYSLWEPGYSDIAVLKVSNDGTLSIKWNLKLSVTGTDELASVIEVYALISDDAITAVPANTDGFAHVGTLASLIADPDGAAYGVLAAGGAKYVALALVMPTTVGNEYQGKAVGSAFDITLSAAQYTQEVNGFGSNQYDAAAPLD